MLELGKRILQRMAELGIKSRVELADKISSTGDSTVHENTVGKWISGEAKPRGENLIALAKALKMSVEKLAADVVILEEGQNPEQFSDEVREMIRDVVKRELKLLLGKDTSTPTDDSELARFLSSEKIPKEDKDSIVRQIKNLLERYGD